MTMPCRILTDAEIEQAANALQKPYLFIKDHWQDPMYCPFHETDSPTVEALIEKAEKEGHFSWCLLQADRGPINPDDTYCQHFAIPHYYDTTTHMFEEVKRGRIYHSS